MKALAVSATAMTLACLLLGISPVEAASSKNKNKNKNNSKSQQNSNQQVAKARADLQNQQRDAAAAAARLNLAKSQIDDARDKAVDTRNEVVKERDRAPSLQAARKLWEEARIALAQASEPVLDKLEQDPQYKEAVAERDALRQQATKLKADTPAQSRVQSEWSQASVRVRQLEKGALLADPRTKSAMEALEREEADARELIERKEQEIKSDPNLSAATAEIRQAKAMLTNAQANYAAELRQLAQAQQNLATRANQAAASKKNQGKGKGNKRRR